MRDLEILKKIHSNLGIPEDYGVARELVVFSEADNLTKLANDIDARSFYLDPDCALAWQKMKAQAYSESINLKAYSGFRTYEYQRNLIQRRIESGVEINEVLSYLAAPGYSEHHTGLAIDITTDDSEAGSEEFEKTAAFSWLEENAAGFGFKLSYPRNNPWGFVYEPWHWSYQRS